MMKSLRIVAVFSVVTLLISCSALAAVDRPKNQKVEAQAKAVKEVELVADGNCSKPCVVIGKVSIKKETIFSTCAAKLSRHALKDFGADAILQFKETQMGLAYGSAGMMCEGVAVRWARDGENGISKITDDVPIPILKLK